MCELLTVFTVDVFVADELCEYRRCRHCLFWTQLNIALENLRL